MNRDGAAAKTARLSVMLVLALIMSYVENAVGFNVGVPGVKIGFANVVVLFALYRFGVSCAFGVNICRILLSALLFGNVFSLMYSLAGGLLSFALMVGVKRTGWFGITGVSVIGAVCHNIAQLCAAAMVMGSGYVFSYAPVLIIAGTVFGAITGAVCHILVKKIPEKF